MALVLNAQGSEEEAVVAMVILALLTALVRASAAGCAVAGGTACVGGAPPRGGVPGRGHAPSQRSRGNHRDAPVSGRGGRLGLDVQVLVGGGEVQVRGLTQVPIG